MITRREYKEARRFIRDNGYSVLHWLSPRQVIVFAHLQIIENTEDNLAERARVVAWCKREKISYNFNHLAKF